MIRSTRRRPAGAARPGAAGGGWSTLGRTRGRYAPPLPADKPPTKPSADPRIIDVPKMPIPDRFYPAIAQIQKQHEFFDVMHKAMGELRIEKGSDFNLDNIALPVQPARLPIELLLSAADHYSAFRMLTDESREKGGEWHTSAPWTLMRAALEQASQAIWLAAEDDRDERIRRYLRMLRHNGAQATTATELRYRRKDREKYRAATIKHRELDFANLITKYCRTSNQVSTVDRSISLLDCIREAARLSDVTFVETVERYWRLASGYAHGLEWTRLAAGLSTFHVDEEGRPAGMFGLDPEKLSYLVVMVTGTFHHALWLMRKRCGSSCPDSCPKFATLTPIDFLHFL